MNHAVGRRRRGSASVHGEEGRRRRHRASRRRDLGALDPLAGPRRPSRDVRGDDGAEGTTEILRTSSRSSCPCWAPTWGARPISSTSRTSSSKAASARWSTPSCPSPTRAARPREMEASSTSARSSSCLERLAPVRTPPLDQGRPQADAPRLLATPSPALADTHRGSRDRNAATTSASSFARAGSPGRASAARPLVLDPRPRRIRRARATWSRPASIAWSAGVARDPDEPARRRELGGSLPAPLQRRPRRRRRSRFSRTLAPETPRLGVVGFSLGGEHRPPRVLAPNGAQLTRRRRGAGRPFRRPLDLARSARGARAAHEPPLPALLHGDAPRRPTAACSSGGPISTRGGRERGPAP